ncbi:hypothetical protein SAMN05216601_11820 [Ectopseudomonas composti]|uniref:Uncharacterized protein n=1 Tax=Ectopseudomonas composti TaxID=658457 RepID=A0A1I5S157_9GAMM|nr:hypothetical protein [Pseudomonas composti]SFP64473.1 hypothetical protein SAMN05216601_11820 [Pseudomonas composti]
MLRIELKAAQSGQPGHGELTVHGWQEGSDALELTVQRNQDGRYLGESGEWDTSPSWHTLDGLNLVDEKLNGEVGPWLIDPLMLDPQMAYMLQLRNEDGSDKGVLRILGTILSSKAAGNSSHDEKKVERKAEPVIAPVVEPEPVPLPEPEAEPEPVELSLDEPLVAEPIAPPPPATVKNPSKLPLILIILLLVLALAAAAWWFLLRKPATEDTAATSSTTPAAGDAAVCSAQALSEGSEDLAFIQACLKSNPSSEQVLEMIAAAKEAKRCGVVQRLYAHKAQSGDAAVAYAYAREYDPQHHTSGGCIEAADGETAAYWYEIAVNNDPGNQDASQRLEELKK